MVHRVSGKKKYKAVFPVEINNKTFYGCCNSCISKLTYNTGNAQIAVDPNRSVKINKADAYIRISPENNHQAMFFESNNIYNQYLKSIKN